MNNEKYYMRKEVRLLPVYNAGLSIQDVQKKYDVDNVIKLASNENPLGPSPKVISAVKLEACHSALYPDHNCNILRRALAQHLNIDEGLFVFGNGSEDLISVICRAYLDHGDQVVTILPSFGLHIIYPQAVGAEVIGVPVGDNMRVDVKNLMSSITPRTRILMLSSPSNPVGCALNEDELKYVVDYLPAHTLLVFDEAYFEYANGEMDYPDSLNILQQSQCSYIILRTFSKAYALAGLRIGYGITSTPSLAEGIDRLRTPFNVNRYAQVAAIAALADQDHLFASVEHVRLERQRMSRVLRELPGLYPLPSVANFIFCHSSAPVAKINDSLLQQGIIIKPWLEVGYTNFIRVSIGSRDDNEIFIQGLKKALQQ